MKKKPKPLTAKKRRIPKDQERVYFWIQAHSLNGKSSKLYPAGSATRAELKALADTFTR
jgi:hypothetical protein